MATIYHPLMAASSIIMHHVKKQKLSQNGFMNVSQVYLSGLPSHQI